MNDGFVCVCVCVSVCNRVSNYDVKSKNLDKYITRENLYNWKTICIICSCLSIMGEWTTLPTWAKHNDCIQQLQTKTNLVLNFRGLTICKAGLGWGDKMQRRVLSNSREALEVSTSVFHINAHHPCFILSHRSPCLFPFKTRNSPYGLHSH